MVRSIAKIQLSFLTVFLFALHVFAGGAVVGKVTIVKGQVFIVRGSEKLAVKKDTTVLESDVIEAQAGTARITMIDSNLVDVYPKSKVEIAKYVYKPNLDQKDVELKIDFGKVKSTVNQKYDGAKNKFQVKTPSAVAGVRGTVFTAEYDAVKKVSKVITIEGLVAVAKMLDRERQSPPVFVRPDQVVKVDPEQSKTEQPRTLNAEEREKHRKEDKDLGYQYDPKNEATPASGESTSSRGHNFRREESNNSEDRDDVRNNDKEVREDREITTKEIKYDKEGGGRSDREDQEIAIKEVKPIKEVKEVKEVVVKEVKEIAVKEVEVHESKALGSAIKEVVTDTTERRQEQQERRQSASEDEQAKKQKQSEDEQAKKQKQLEDEQAKKQKQVEDEQAKKQKRLEDEQVKREEEQKKRSDDSARRTEEGSRLGLPSGAIGTIINAD